MKSKARENMGRLQTLRLSFFQSLALHFAILAFFVVGFITTDTEKKKPKKPVPEIIQASILDEDKIQEEAERQKMKEIARREDELKRKKRVEEQLRNEQQRIKQLQQQRIAEERKAKERAEKLKQEEIREKKRLADLKKKAEETERQAKLKEQQRRAAAEKARKEEQKRKQAEARKQAEEKKRQEAAAKARAEEQKRETERQAAIQREKQAEAQRAAAAAKRKADQDQIAMASATQAIIRKVQNRWIRPRISTQGLQCTIRVKLLSGGDVMQATVIESSGNEIFDRSAENAVRKASPLPVPADKDLFNRSFKSFTFIFKPQ